MARFGLLLTGLAVAGVAAAAISMRRVSASPPAPPPPPAPSLASFTPYSWAESRNPSSPIQPAGYERIILINGNQDLKARIGGLVLVTNPESIATLLFTLEMEVRYGGKVRRLAQQVNGQTAFIRYAGAPPLTPAPDYSGPGAGTTRVGLISLAPASSIALAFSVTLDALADPWVGAIELRAVLKDADGGQIAAASSSGSYLKMFVNGVEGAVASALPSLI